MTFCHRGLACALWHVQRSWPLPAPHQLQPPKRQPKCLQTLPPILLSAKLPPVENHWFKSKESKSVRRDYCFLNGQDRSDYWQVETSVRGHQQSMILGAKRTYISAVVVVTLLP